MGKVSSKYQIVIPKDVRKQLRIKPGSKVEIMSVGGATYIVPVWSMAEIQKRFAGKLDTSNYRDKKDRRF